ncbi:MAG: hypothetical protein E7359_04220 [Clostridiales bacterium]|nr:hypothetical protein [Clostridiales bacterium]
MKKVKKFTEFRNNSNFNMPSLIEKDNCIYFSNEIVEDVEKKYSEGESFLNIGYNFKLSKARVLSNLYPMEFVFRGKKVKSIEGVLQGIKYKDKKLQNLVLNYFGLDAYHTRACNEADFWGQTGKLYWQGKEINRFSEDYQLFLDELYISAVKNPLYKRALLNTGNKYLLHHIGRNDPNETVLTRYEYESRLNLLRDFIKI